MLSFCAIARLMFVAKLCSFHWEVGEGGVMHIFLSKRHDLLDKRGCHAEELKLSHKDGGGGQNL